MNCHNKSNDAILRSGRAPGQTTLEADDQVQKELASEDVLGTPRGVKPTLVLMSSVTSKPLRWIWPGRLPLGKMVVLEGAPGLGKSVLALDLAARVSRGDSMPDGARGDVDGPAGVVLLSARDDPEETIGPRLDAAGADVERVVLMTTVTESAAHPGNQDRRQRPVTIGDIEAIRDAIVQSKARLVIIDPLMAFLSGDAHRDQNMRQALTSLNRLAPETGATVLVVRHLNKSATGKALQRGRDSIGIISAARGVLNVAKDPEDAANGRLVLTVTKCNFATCTKRVGSKSEVCSDLVTESGQGEPNATDARTGSGCFRGMRCGNNRRRCHRGGVASGRRLLPGRLRLLPGLGYRHERNSFDKGVLACIA